MTKKCYAAIMSAKENMAKIENMIGDVMHSPTRAYSTLKTVLEIVEKWNKDFGNCDPNWQPTEKETPNAASKNNVMALGAFVQDIKASA